MTETQFRWFVLALLASIKASLLALLFYETENGLFRLACAMFSVGSVIGFLMALGVLRMPPDEPDEEEEPTP